MIDFTHGLQECLFAVSLILNCLSGAEEPSLEVLGLWFLVNQTQSLCAMWQRELSESTGFHQGLLDLSEWCRRACHLWWSWAFDSRSLRQSLCVMWQRELPENTGFHQGLLDLFPPNYIPNPILSQEDLNYWAVGGVKILLPFSWSWLSGVLLSKFPEFNTCTFIDIWWLAILTILTVSRNATEPPRLHVLILEFAR
jgi:hypothetical protein